MLGQVHQLLVLLRLAQEGDYALLLFAVLDQRIHVKLTQNFWRFVQDWRLALPLEPVCALDGQLAQGWRAVKLERLAMPDGRIVRAAVRNRCHRVDADASLGLRGWVLRHLAYITYLFIELQHHHLLVLFVDFFFPIELVYGIIGHVRLLLGIVGWNEGSERPR